MNGDFQPGSSHPLGATVQDDGTNFSLFSRSASRVELVFFDRADDARPCGSIELSPESHRTYHYWHAFVPGIKPGQLYGYRVHGPSDPARGMRFDPTKVLLDPYGRGVVVPSEYDRTAAEQPGDNAGAAMKSVVADLAGYDWQGDAPLRRPSSRTVIYEMHIAGFTRHPSSGVAEAKRGTYAGMIEKIPHLQELGVTAVELLPVFQFDAQDCPPGRVNYWGYAAVAFFAPHQAYSLRQDPLGPLDEFRDLVKALHRAGIEVILDVVFNHMHRFVKLLVARRLLRGTQHERQRLSLTHLIREANKAWHGVRLNQPDWSDHSRSVALTVEVREDKLLVHLILNAYWERLEFELPPVPNSEASPWRRWIDTARDTPEDIVPWQEAPSTAGLTYQAEARSVVVLYAPLFCRT